MQLPRALLHETFAQSIMCEDTGLSPRLVGHGCSPPSSISPKVVYGVTAYGNLQHGSYQSLRTGFGALRKTNGSRGSGGGGAEGRWEYGKSRRWPEHVGGGEGRPCIGDTEWPNQETVLRPLQRARLMDCSTGGGAAASAAARAAALGKQFHAARVQHHQQQYGGQWGEENTTLETTDDRIRGGPKNRKLAAAPDKICSQSAVTSRRPLDDALPAPTARDQPRTGTHPPQPSQPPRWFEMQPQDLQTGPPQEFSSQPQHGNGFVLDRGVLTRLLLAGAAARRRRSSPGAGLCGSSLQGYPGDHQPIDEYSVWHQGVGQWAADDDGKIDISPGLPVRSRVAAMAAVAASGLPQQSDSCGVRAAAGLVRISNTAEHGRDQEPLMERPYRLAGRELYGVPGVVYGDMQDGPECRQVQAALYGLAGVEQMRQLENAGILHGLDVGVAGGHGGPHAAAAGLQRRMQRRAVTYPAVQSDGATLRQTLLQDGSPPDLTMVAGGQKLLYASTAMANQLPSVTPDQRMQEAAAVGVSSTTASHSGSAPARKSDPAVPPGTSTAASEDRPAAGRSSLAGSPGGAAPKRTRLTAAGAGAAPVANTRGVAPQGKQRSNRRAPRGQNSGPSSAAAHRLNTAEVEAIEAADLDVAAEVLLLLGDAVCHTGEYGSRGSGARDACEKQRPVVRPRPQPTAPKRKAVEGSAEEAVPQQQLQAAAVADERPNCAGLEAHSGYAHGEQACGALRRNKRLRCVDVLETHGGRRSGSTGGRKEAQVRAEDVALRDGKPASCQPDGVQLTGQVAWNGGERLMTAETSGAVGQRGAGERSRQASSVMGMLAGGPSPGQQQEELLGRRVDPAPQTRQQDGEQQIHQILMQPSMRQWDQQERDSRLQRLVQQRYEQHAEEQQQQKLRQQDFQMHAGMQRHKKQEQQQVYGAEDEYQVLRQQSTRPFTTLGPAPAVQMRSPCELDVAERVSRILPRQHTRKAATIITDTTNQTAAAAAAVIAAAAAAAAAAATTAVETNRRDTWPRLLSSTIRSGAAPPGGDPKNATINTTTATTTIQEQREQQVVSDSPREYDDGRWYRAGHVSTVCSAYSARAASDMGAPGHTQHPLPLIAGAQEESHPFRGSGADAWAVVHGLAHYAGANAGGVGKKEHPDSTHCGHAAAWEIQQPASSPRQPVTVTRHPPAAAVTSGRMPDDLQAGDPAGGAHHDVDQRQHLSDAWQQHLQQHHMPPVLQDAAAPPVTNPDRSKLRILSGSRWGPAEISSSQWTACGLRNPAEQLLLQQQNQQQQEDEAWQSMRRGMDLKPSNAAAAANAYGDARAEAILTTASGNVAAAALGWAAQDRAKSRTYIRPLASMQESTSKDSLKQASRAKDGKQGQQLSAKTAPGEGDARELERASERSAGRLDLQHEREGRDTLVGRREGPQSPAHEAPQNQQQQQGQEELQQEGWQEQQRLQYTHMAQQLRQLLLLQKQLQLGGGYQLDQAPIIADVNGSSGHRSGSTEVIAHAQQDRVEGSKGAQLSSGGAQRYGGKDSTPVIDATTRKLLSGVRVGAAFAVSKLHETQPSLKAPVERASAYPTAQVSVPGGTLRTALDVNGSLAAGTAVGPAAAKASDVASPGTAGPAADATGEPGFPSADSASPTGESTETHITTGPPATATGSAAAVASAAVASTTAPDRARPEPHLKQPGASSRRGAATASGEGGHVNDGIEGDEEQCYRAPDQGPGSGSGGAATAAVSTVAASGRGGGVEITMEDLRRTFLLPAPQAARVLRTSTTNLKRKCRQLGILRWPHRKLDSLHRLRTLVLNEVRDAGEQQALLDSISRNTEEILQDPNLGLAPALKNLRQAYYKRGFDVRARGLGRAPGTADSDDSM